MGKKRDKKGSSLEEENPMREPLKEVAKELQEYFKRQQWYVPQIAANDFDTSCLNEVEKYNVNLISVYEEQIGGK